jgi:hypothetical protein
MGTSHEDLYTFKITSCSVPLRMRNISEQFAEKIKTYLILNTFFFENLGKYMVEPDRPQMTI